MALETFYAKAAQTDGRTVAQKVKIIRQPQIHPHTESGAIVGPLATASSFSNGGENMVYARLHNHMAMNISEETSSPHYDSCSSLYGLLAIIMHS